MGKIKKRIRSLFINRPVAYHLAKKLLFLSVFMVSMLYIVSSQEQVKLPILLYHNIAPSYPAESEQLHITPECFREHMTALKTSGFTPISFQEYYDYRVSGASLPDKPIIISFDDGYITNYEYAYPILKELNMKATFFAVTKSSFYPTAFPIPHYDWAMANEMQSSGLIDIESHSYTHPKHTDLTLEKIEQEARLSYYDIQTFLHKEPLVYSYPNGAFSEQTKQIVRKAGYKMQVKVGNDGVNTNDTPLDELVRINIGGLTTSQQLIQMLENYLKP